MDNNLKSYFEEVDNYTNEVQIIRWQLQVYTYLEEAYGVEKAKKFESYGSESDTWDTLAQQKGYLEALIKNNIQEIPVIVESMRRIDRLNLIDTIGRRLQSEMTYADIDVYLSGFDVDTTIQTTDNGGSKWKYVKELLAKQSDKKVLQIANELEIEHSYTHQAVERIAESTFWKTNYFRLFLSHLSGFKVKTAQLQANLKEYGISAFVAHEDIEPTKEWQEEIEKALHSMDALGAILTPKFNQSQWTDQEVGVAIGKNVLIIPIRKGMNPYGFIAKYQGMQGEGKTIGEVSSGIFSIVSTHPKTKEKMATLLVDQLLLAGSVKDAIKKLSLLRSIKALPQRHLEKVRDSSKDNSIIYNSEKFVNLLNQVLEEHGLKHLTTIKIHNSMLDEDIPF